MKKLTIILIISVIMLFSASPAAADNETPTDITEIADTSGIEVPDDADKFLSDNNINPSDAESILSVTPQIVFSYIFESFEKRLTSPLKLLSALMGIILLAAAAESLGDAVKSKGAEKVYEILGVLVSVSVSVEPVYSAVRFTGETLTSGSSFMLGYVPVFASVAASSGNITAAGSYSAVMLTVCEFAVQISSGMLMPIVGMCMGLSIVEAINPTISLSGLNNALNKVMTVGMGLMMTVFVGLLSVQSTIGSAADTVAVKAGKYMVSNFVPVVGGAISDAYTTLKFSLDLLKSGLGGYGIIVLALTVMPALLELLAVMLAVSAGKICAEIFGVKQITALLKGFLSALTSSLCLLLCFSVMLIVSTAVIMTTATRI